MILGIESSCDETSAAIVKNGTEEIYTSLATSRDLHEKTGGVVPEVASRKQLESILPVINDCINGASIKLSLSTTALIQNISAIAVTQGPGLMGSLIVGIEAAKALSLAWGKPIIPVNHLVGHLYANFLTHPNITFPAIGLVVSGGHTDLVLMKGHGNLHYLGGTLDDAAGEAFDKTARLLGLSNYKLGGPALSKKATEYDSTNPVAHKLPRPLIDISNYDFSFSGLKTAVRYLVEKHPVPVEEVAYEFESAVIDVITQKTLNAVKAHSVKSLLMGGGVVANHRLRAKMSALLESENVAVYYPPQSLCGDNATYIAATAHFICKTTSYAQLQPDPSLSITD
jgi:N6-L-threonylcarbamoyladenine synthase